MINIHFVAGLGQDQNKISFSAFFRPLIRTFSTFFLTSCPYDKLTT